MEPFYQFPHTPQEFRKIARACRRLAYACFNGTAPTLGKGGILNQQRRCAAEVVAQMAKLQLSASEGVMVLVVSGNDSASDADRHLAVVFPLMNAADDLESQAAQLEAEGWRTRQGP